MILPYLRQAQVIPAQPRTAVDGEPSVPLALPHHKQRPARRRGRREEKS